jgi:iron complex outermembrane receptor protein
MFELGARVDQVDRDPDVASLSDADFTSYSGSGAAIYQFNAFWNIGLALSYSERAPATEELYSNVENSAEDLIVHAATGVIEIGDPELDKESSINADLSLNWLGERSWAEVTTFYNNAGDYIYLQNSATEIDGTPIYNYEQEDATFYGVELDSSFHLGDVAGGGIELGVFGDMIRGEFDDSGDVPRLPPRRLGASLSWSGPALGAYVRVVNAAEQDNPGEFETETDGYTRWDAGVDYRFSLSDSTEMLAFIKLKNITDEEIRLSTSFLRNYAPQAGQSVEAGIRLTF